MRFVSVEVSSCDWLKHRGKNNEKDKEKDEEKNRNILEYYNNKGKILGRKRKK